MPRPLELQLEIEPIDPNELDCMAGDRPKRYNKEFAEYRSSTS